jgi:hypothetical protein
VKKHWLAREIFTAAGAIIGVALLGYTAVEWVANRIDSAVERKLSDPVILRKIAAEARPTLIFDVNESILADLGAEQFIKNISVTRKKEEPSAPEFIDIDFTVNLPIAPLLTPLQNDAVVITPHRRKGNAWRYRLDYMTLLALAGPTDEANRITKTFRLELLR